MRSSDYSHPHLELIISEEGNFQCVDCSISNPKWVSIQNGVFICGKCARKHQLFSKQISKIKSIEVDIWSKEEISYLRKGGNKRFNKLMCEYNIPITIDNQKYKYYTKIIDYYRKVLFAEVNGDECLISKPNFKEGIELIEEEEENCNSNNNTNVVDVKGSECNIEKSESENKIKNKEINISEEIRNVASSVGKIIEQIGNNISNKVKEMTILQTVKNKAEHGIGYLYEKANGLLVYRNK